MKKIIGVMGPGEKQATKENIECAYHIGKLVGSAGAVLLCGGMSGTMEASAKGAQEVGGLTVGIGPTKDKQDLNQYIDIPILTAMHAGRNFINVLSSDILIFVGVGSAGTLSELAFAIQLEKPIFIVGNSQKLKDYISDFTDNKVIFLGSYEELRPHLNALIDKAD